MDQLADFLWEGLKLYMEKNETSGEGRRRDAAGKKKPAVQGGDSEAEMKMREKMPSYRKSDEGLRFLAAGERPEVQGGDAEEEMEMEVRKEMPSKLRSGERLQLHTAGTMPELQGGDADEMGAVMRSEMLQILMQSMQLGDQKEMLAKLLKYEEGNQQQKQESQRLKQEMLQNLMQSMQLGDEKEMFAKLLKYAENQPQKQKIQQRKQKKKHHRKSRMALRKVEIDKVKKSDLEKAPREDKMAAYMAAWAKEDEAEAESEACTDWHAYEARLCRDSWNDSFGSNHPLVTYETITSIPPMRFTEDVYEYAGPRETLQIFSVKVVETKKDIDWPLYVYGKLVVRDTVDHKCNIMFNRQRDNCQTINEEEPYLTLTGPSRAAVLSVGHSHIEAELKIRRSCSDSDDEDFSYLATAYLQKGLRRSFMEKRVLSSRLSTLEFTVGHIANSVEATITVEVRSGNWPSGYEGAFTVSTASMKALEITLLSFGGGGLPLEDDGKTIRLSRRVVGVELDGRLNVSLKALPPGGSGGDVLSDEWDFTPKEAGWSQLMMKIGSCEMEVKVAWSLLLTYDE